MVASRVGDHIGHRRMVVGALSLFAAASALGAMAHSVWLLAAARGLQGVAAAASVPSTLRLLTTVVPDGPARRRAVAGWSAAGAAAGASGFVVGGVLTEFASWRSVFWMNIALAAVLTIAIGHLIPRDRPTTSGGRLGWTSAILLTGGAMGLVAGTTLLGERKSPILAGAVTTVGVFVVVAFIVVERQVRHPLVAPDAWRTPGLRRGAFGSFFNTATTSSSFTVATLYLQDELGHTPLEAAALLVAFSILVVFGSVAAPRVIAVFGWSAALSCGLGIIAAGNLLLVAWPHTIGVGVAAGVCGFGIGLGSVAATDMGTHVPEAIRATSAGVLNTAAQLGTAIGTALVLLIAITWQPRVAWAAAATFATLAALAAARQPHLVRPDSRNAPGRPA